jgi:hypothetical protein
LPRQNVPSSKLQIASFSMAWLECVMVKIVGFRLLRPNMSWLRSSVSDCSGQMFQNGLYVLCIWSKSLVLTWLECAVVIIISFSKAGMCHGNNCQCKHGYYLSC